MKNTKLAYIILFISMFYINNIYNTQDIKQNIKHNSKLKYNNTQKPKDTQRSSTNIKAFNNTKINSINKSSINNQKRKLKPRPNYKLNPKLNSELNQELRQQTDILNHFFRQPKYTPANIKCFFRHTYNNSKYGEFLAVNFSHVDTFLGYTNKTNYPLSYIDNVLSLFTQKLKSMQFINAYAFQEFLQKLPKLSTYFNDKKEKEEQLENIKKCLYSFLSNRFDYLKQEPDKALEELSESIYSITDLNSTDLNINNEELDLPIFKLQHTLIIFLETALSKLIWSPQDQKEIWKSVKFIANQLEELLIKNMLPGIETLDELFWSLINRFCYFLDIAGAELTDNCYQIINNEIATQRSLLWDLKEKESFITSKLKYLQIALMKAEVKSKAYKSGIIADLIY